MLAGVLVFSETLVGIVSSGSSQLSECVWRVEIHTARPPSVHALSQIATVKILSLLDERAIKEAVIQMSCRGAGETAQSVCCLPCKHGGTNLTLKIHEKS